ncbi:MAG: SusC/RagA family TonB-linked outer membrane protein [Bacteroidales bacterium]
MRMLMKNACSLLLVLLLTTIGARAQELQISGKVTDSEGASLPGVTIVEKGTANGTLTDAEGRYAIKEIRPNAVLVFSFVGMQTQEVTVSGKRTIHVQMQADAIGLDEVVAVGYGVMKKRDLTGSVASVKMDDVAANPSNNPLETLQGRVSGIDLTRSSGQAGSGVSMTMRGERSLNASNSPLILVDGVAYGSTLDINPTDIQSMEILKDASSTAIYGSRGANGVILITTKKGTKGKSTISFNAYYSMNQLTDYPKFMNSEQYINLKREAYRTEGVWNDTSNDADIFSGAELDNFKKGYDVNWFDELLSDGYTQNYELAMRGGNEKTSYSFSLGVQDEQGLLKTNDHYTRYNGRLALDHQLNDKLRVGANFLYTYKEQDNRNASFWNIGKLLPIAKAYNDDGTVNTYPTPGRSDALNPLVDDFDGAIRDNTATVRFFGTTHLNWKIADGLVFNTTLGIDQQNATRGYYYAKQTTRTADAYSESGADLTGNRNLTWENTLNYEFKLPEQHGLNAMLGTSTIANRQEAYNLYGRNQAAEITENFDLSSNTEGITTTSDLVRSQLASFFGRVNYRFKERYLLTASMRADGSSVLAEGNKWGYFPSLAAGWRINEENFMNHAVKVSNLKLRVSWGQSGQSGVDPYSTLATLDKSTYAFTTGAGELAAYGYYPATISNPDLTWETTSVFDVGLDFGFFDNRISGALDYYKSVTSNILMPRLIPNTTGYTSVFENVGETKGTGIDVSLNTLNVENTRFSWSTDINFSYNANEISKLSEGLTQDVGNGWFLGEPINVIYDYAKEGIWQTNEAKRAEEYDRKPGQIKVQDVDLDGDIDADDRVVYNASPKFTFGITNRLSYSNFDFSFFLYGRLGYHIDYNYYGAFRPGSQENQANVDYWTPENPTNAFPRPSTENYPYKSTLNYVKGDFIKIKDITLAYSMPDKVLEKWSLSKLRFYMTLKNHFTFSGIENYDPERGGSIDYPLTKQTVFGVNLEF